MLPERHRLLRRLVNKPSRIDQVPASAASADRQDDNDVASSRDILRDERISVAPKRGEQTIQSGEVGEIGPRYIGEDKALDWLALSRDPR